MTGLISVVGAGLYPGSLLNEITELLQRSFRLETHSFAAFFCIAVTICFWWSNVKGIHESSGKALRIMQITTVKVVAPLIWHPITLLIRGNAQLPPGQPHRIFTSPGNPPDGLKEPSGRNSPR